MVLFAGMAVAAKKNVAVVEVLMDPSSNAAKELTAADRRTVTDELRRRAVKNLPSVTYNIMTSETVIAQGGATLEKCAEENCVITLGSKIGADYIVRGIISKLEKKYTLTIEIYETENGNLVASSEPVRAEKIGKLVEEAAGACADMFKEFVNRFEKAQNSVRESAEAKGLDLDKLLVDDEEGDLLTEEKPVVAKPAIDSVAAARESAAPDSQAVGAGTQPSDSGTRVSARPPAPGRRGPPPPKSADAAGSGAADIGPAVVEEGRTINFAQNLKEYKSPRLAMLLSLLLPGLGQAYSRSYVKASAFGAVELAAIGTAFYLNDVAVSKRKDAYKFADKYFSIDKMKTFDERLRDEMDKLRSEDNTLPVIPKDSLPLPYDKYFYDAARSKSAYYYESIREKDYTPGWEGYNLSLERILYRDDGVTRRGESDTIHSVKSDDKSRYLFYHYSNPDMFYYVKEIVDYAGNAVDGGGRTLGYSSRQAEYNDMMDNSNSYRDAVNYMFYVMILNHIASAIDAGFTARAHNARLLGEDKSAWSRLSVEQQFVHTGSGRSPGAALRLRF
jgi:hypothetical protein